MRDELDLQLAGHHLPLRFGIETDVAHDRLAQEPGANKLANPLVRRRRVVGDDRQVALVLAHDLVDDALGRADAPESRRSSGLRHRGSCEPIVRAKLSASMLAPERGLLRSPSAINGQRGSPDLSSGFRTEENHHRANLLWSRELTRRLLFRQQLGFGRIHRDLLALGAFIDLLFVRAASKPSRGKSRCR